MTFKTYYEQYWSEEGFKPTGRITKPIEKLLREHTSPGSICLDVGCGDGRTTGVWLSERTASYVGVDISERAVAAARSIGLDARVIEDATAVPFPDDHFTLVVCVEVLEHLIFPHLAAAEMFRVLKPGGVLLATVPNAAYWRRRADLAVFGRWNPLGDDLSVEQPWRDPHIRFLTASSLRRMLGSARFAPVDVGGHGGTILGDIPYLRRLCRRRCGWVTHDWSSNAIYARFERRAPSVFGYRLHAVARKPGSA